MLIDFRQGLVRAPANFLMKNGKAVSLQVPPNDTVIAAIADGTADYLISEKQSITNAWAGPFEPGTNYWLYWNIDLVTGARTFGHTALEPFEGPTPPANPLPDQHWFDTGTKQMKVFNGTSNRWNRVIRVFAAQLEQGGVFVGMGSDTSGFTGTQAGLTGRTNAGALLFDNLGGVLKKKDGTYFTTEDYALTGIAQSSQVKFASVQIRAEAATYIPSLTLVQFVDYNRVVPASVHVVDKVNYGVLEFDANVGDVVNITVDGVIRSGTWNFQEAGVPMNAPVYIDANGALTTTPSTPPIPVGTVIDVDAILLRPSSLFMGDNIGEKGDPGPIGYTGSAGAAGPAGADGALGYTGSQGEIGYTGSAGEKGERGDTGYVGSRGADGAQGLDGAMGPVGYTGSAGTDGAQGATGYTGSRGADGTSITVKGALTSTADLPASGNVSGDCYIIDGNLYVWNGSAWSNAGAVQGPTGFTGSAGPAGPQGIQGNVGYTGSAGPAGPAGSAGGVGYTGSQGPTGFTGSAGSAGAAGPAGATGSIGYTGSAGAAGPAGATGFTGSAGAQGIQGNIGYTGSASTVAGPAGATGYTGSAGAGYTGSQGATGFTGSQGPQGIQGNIGYTGSASTVAGPAGATGFTGSMGYTGSAGAGYTGSAGAAGPAGATGYTGSQGYTGSAGAGFTGSAGATGYTGSQGAQGVQGNIGYTGSASTVAGPAGATGFTGSMGYTGSAGAGYTGSASTVPGPMGYTGSQGYTGSAGAGFTGSAGATGYTGSAGTQGIQGNIGYTGSKGDTGSAGPIGYTGSAGAGGSVTVKDEGTTLAAAATSINFAGAGVTATASGNDITVTIPGGGSGGGASVVTRLITTGGGAARVVISAVGSQAELDAVTATISQTSVANDTMTIGNVASTLKITSFTYTYDASFTAATNVFILYPEQSGGTSPTTMMYPVMIRGTHTGGVFGTAVTAQMIPTISGGVVKITSANNAANGAVYHRVSVL